MEPRGSLATRIVLIVSCLAAACGGDDGAGAAGTGTSTGATAATAATSSGTNGDTTGTSSSSTTTAGDGSGTEGNTSTGGGGDPDPVPPDLLGCDNGPVGATLVVSPADDYRAMIPSMQPGDVMRFVPGTYDLGLPVTDRVGSPGKCFFFESQDPEDPAVFLGSDSRNTVSIRDSRYVVVRDLILDGDGRLGDGVKAEGNATFADHIVLSGLTIVGHGADQQIVGISTKTTAWSWWIHDNRIEGAGTGMYLGNSDGSAPFVGGLIERNLVVDTLGYNIQIKHQIPRPNLPGLPTDPVVTILRHNVLSKANGASGGDLARPNLLLGHLPLSGPGQDDRYLVYGNFLYHNAVDALFQAEGNLAIYDNLFVNPAGSAVHIQPHNDVPKLVDVFFNTVVASGNGIRVSGGDPNFTQRVFGNAVFAGTPLSGGETSDNLAAATEEASVYLIDPVADPGAGLDLHPKPDAGGPIQGVPDLSGVMDLVAADRDFDGRPRGAGFLGAYAGPADPGAWAPALEPKP